METPGFLARAPWRLVTLFTKGRQLRITWGQKDNGFFYGILRCLWDPRVQMSTGCWVFGPGIQTSDEKQSH